MGTKNNPGEFDCYAAAEPDEPMFVLLGRDRHAPALVWLWAALRELDDEDPKKVAEARECVTAMVQHLDSKGKKACGLIQATMAGVFDLVRVANTAARTPVAKNDATDVEHMRRWLSILNVEGPGDATG